MESLVRGDDMLNSGDVRAMRRPAAGRDQDVLGTDDLTGRDQPYAMVIFEDGAAAYDGGGIPRPVR